MKKTNVKIKGFSHLTQHLILAAVILLVGGGGTIYLTSSHADSLNDNHYAAGSLSFDECNTTIRGSESDADQTDHLARVYISIDGAAKTQQNGSTQDNKFEINIGPFSGTHTIQVYGADVNSGNHIVSSSLGSTTQYSHELAGSSVTYKQSDCASGGGGGGGGGAAPVAPSAPYGSYNFDGNGGFFLITSEDNNSPGSGSAYQVLYLHNGTWIHLLDGNSNVNRVHRDAPNPAGNQTRYDIPSGNTKTSEIGPDGKNVYIDFRQCAINHTFELQAVDLDNSGNVIADGNGDPIGAVTLRNGDANHLSQVGFTPTTNCASAPAAPVAPVKPVAAPTPAADNNQPTGGINSYDTNTGVVSGFESDKDGTSHPAKILAYWTTAYAPDTSGQAKTTPDKQTIYEFDGPAGKNSWTYQVPKQYMDCNVHQLVIKAENIDVNGDPAAATSNPALTITIAGKAQANIQFKSTQPACDPQSPTSGAVTFTPAPGGTKPPTTATPKPPTASGSKGNSGSSSGSGSKSGSTPTKSPVAIAAGTIATAVATAAAPATNQATVTTDTGKGCIVYTLTVDSSHGGCVGELRLMLSGLGQSVTPNDKKEADPVFDKNTDKATQAAKLNGDNSFDKTNWETLCNQNIYGKSSAYVTARDHIHCPNAAISTAPPAPPAAAPVQRGGGTGGSGTPAPVTTPQCNGLAPEAKHQCENNAPQTGGTKPAPPVASTAGNAAGTAVSVTQAAVGSATCKANPGECSGTSISTNLQLSCTITDTSLSHANHMYTPEAFLEVNNPSPISGVSVDVTMSDDNQSVAITHTVGPIAANSSADHAFYDFPDEQNQDIASDNWVATGSYGQQTFSCSGSHKNGTSYF